MTSKKTVGTCPVCFQLITLTSKGTITRHGWKVYGNRQVGHYDQTWHSGPCFGAGYEPFEVSFKGTVDCFWQVLVPKGKDALEAVEHLASRPVIIEVASSIESCREEGWGGKSFYPQFSVRLQPGDENIQVEKGYYAKKFSYEKVHAYQTEKATRYLNHVLADAAHFCEKVAEWKPQAVQAKVEPVKPTKPTHFRRNGMYSVCGKSHTAVNGRVMAPSTTKREEVTCQDCKDGLDMFLHQQAQRGVR